jgi:apolipoprotein N-acyltransferase
LAIARRRPLVVAFVLGGLVALALPPFYLWPALLGFAGLLHLLRRTERRWQALLLGWSFGFGHFLAGLYWIAIAFFTDPERFGALAVPAVLLLCAGLALYPALAGWLTVLYRWRSPVAAALALAFAWTATEALRGTLFGGFPWNLIGYTWAGSIAISQLAAVTGAYGMSLTAVTLGALPAALLESEDPRRHWRALAVSALGLALVWAGGAARLNGGEPSAVPGIRLRLVQGNIAQHHKWQPELRARWFQRYLDLSAQSPAGVTDVIWPESATPYPLEQDPTARAMVAAVVPPGGLLVTGGERFDLSSEPPRAWNSLFVLDDQGTVRAHYDKRDLVPFGEFLPFRDLLGRLGLEKLTRGSIDFQPGPRRETVTLPGLPPFSPLICYEAIFPGQVVDPRERPSWLLNITNDAWFGRSSGPYQHFAMARMRAIEEGLPLVRSANTGISAVIDPWGRVTASLALDETGVLDAALPQPLPGATIFARLGVWSIVVLAGLGALAMAFVEKRAPRAVPEVNKSAKHATTC